MSEFVDVEWFGREQTIGFVLTYDEFDGFKVRCGVATGLNEKADAEMLMREAAKIPFEWAWGIWGKRMLATWQDKHLDLDSWPTVRYDRIDYDVKTLEEVKGD